MSEQAREFFRGVHQPDQSQGPVSAFVDRFVAEIGAEGKRLGTQGSMELASALFAGHAFVPYGPGQYTPSVEADASAELEVDLGRENELEYER